MSFMQGSPLPDVTVTTTSQQEVPDYYSDYLEKLGQAGETALGMEDTKRVAGMDPMQTTGYAGIEDAAEAYENLFGKAETAAEGFGGIDAANISDFLNPYQSGVLDEMERRSALNVQRNLLPQLKAGFVGSGGLGGQRYAGALGQSLADVQSNLTGQQSELMYKGYQDAIANAFKQAQEERQAATTQADLAELAQELELAEMAALIEGGAQKQAFEQSKIEAPLKTAMNVAQLMRGFQIPLDETRTEKGPKPGAYSTSTFQDIGSILGLIGAYGGNAPANANPLSLAASGAKDIVQLFKDIDFGLSSTNPIEGNQYYEIGTDAGSADVSDYGYY
jgi:hypothetical protein